MNISCKKYNETEARLEPSEYKIYSNLSHLCMSDIFACTVKLSSVIMGSGNVATFVLAVDD